MGRLGDAYLGYLEKKEKRVTFSFKNKSFSHGQLTSYLRVFKGIILGFGLGNLLISRVKNLSFLYNLVVLLLLFCISVLLINYERRYYNRKTFRNSIKKAIWIFLVCLLFSSIVLLYSNYKGFIVVLALTLFFSSFAYSME